MLGGKRKEGETLKALRHSLQWSLLWIVATLVLGQVADAQWDGGGSRGGDAEPFQFSDDFYLENGIDPTKLVDKLVFPDAREGFDRTRGDEAVPNSNFNDVRITETTGGFDKNGDVLYYIIPGKLFSDAFTDDRDGEQALETANRFP